MASRIEWLARPGTTPETWNPISGCHVRGKPWQPHSPGCAHCWAKAFSGRLAGRFGYDAEEPFQLTAHWDRLEDPWRWRKPRTVFVVSMGDLFHPSMPWLWIERVFNVMVSHRARRHTFILCTKQAAHMREFISTCYPGLDRCSPHIWGLVTAEDQQRADERIPELLATPLAVRGISVEPMLGRLDLHPWLYACPVCGERPWDCSGAWRFNGAIWEHYHDYPVGHVWTEPDPQLNWAIVGSESGPNARPCQLEWVRDIVRQCQAAAVPAFVKQVHIDGIGRTASALSKHPQEWPQDLRVREWPEAGQ